MWKVTERRNDIDEAKGLAILLVVFGHLVARAYPANVGWYEQLRRSVYAFHMPFFFYLSGFTAALSGMLDSRRTELLGLAPARARRLLLPFVGMGLLVVAGKAAASRFIFVDNVPPGLLPGLQALVWNTARSPSLSIWYLFVLFVLSLGTVALLDGRMQRLPWLLGGALLLFSVPVPPYIYLDRVATFAPFFLMGALARFAGIRWEGIIDRFWPLAMAVFLAVLFGVALGGRDAKGLTLMLAGTISLPALHGCLRNLRTNWLQRGLLTLGRYSFIIYLFNTLFIGATKGLLLFAWSWDGPHFPAFACALMSGGLAGPIMLKRYALRRFRVLDRLTD